MKAVSLLLCVAVCAVWARGRLYHESVHWIETRRDDAGDIVRVTRYSANVAWGRLALSRTVYNAPILVGSNPFITEWPDQNQPTFGWRRDRLRETPSWELAEFHFINRVRDDRTFRSFGVPFWAIVLALAAVSVLRLVMYFP